MQERVDTQDLGHIHGGPQWDDKVGNAIRDLSSCFCACKGGRDRRGRTGGGECHGIRWNQLFVELDRVSVGEANIERRVNEEHLAYQSGRNSRYKNSNIGEDLTKVILSPIAAAISEMIANGVILTMTPLEKTNRLVSSDKSSRE